MNNSEYGYCNNCGDLVRFEVEKEHIEETFHGKKIDYYFKVGRCADCGSELATDIDYNTRKSKAKIDAYNSKYEPKLKEIEWGLNHETQ